MTFDQLQPVSVGDLTFDVRTLGPEDGEPVLLLHERDHSDDVASDEARVRELLACLVDADATDPGALQEVLFALYTLLSAHFWREEAVLVKLAALADEDEVREVVRS